jgi:signal transduction histidine kinase
MEEILNKERRQQYLALLFSGFTSVVALYLIQTFHSYMPIYSINLVTLAVNVNNIFFFYKLLDMTEMHFKIKLRSKWAMYLLEFSKLAFAFFVTSVINFHAIMGPVFNQNYDPHYHYTFLAFSIPAAAISRIIFELRQARELTLQLRVAQAEAQYNLLEAQMQPHFLFNSLNVLSELIYADPDLACSVTQQLADLYREILTNSKQNFSNLGSEISILRKYIQIQKIRFGDRIQFRTDVNPDFYHIAVPSLILQTLVENAIKHGISPKQEGGEIELSVTHTPDDMYEICIANTGQLYQPAKNKEHGKKELGTGLQNTKNRLDLFYGSSHGFRIYSDGKKTYVIFKVKPETISPMETV